MKKNLMYLFTLLCSLGLLVACSSDDDDPKVDEAWRELSDTYKDTSLELKLEGYQVSSTTGFEKTAVVNATSAEVATVKLNNVVPENKEVSIDAKLTQLKQGDGFTYSISGETTVDGCKVAISGKFQDDGKLLLDVTRTLSSAITGNLGLKFAEGVGVPIHWKAVTGIEVVDAQLAIVGPMLGGLIAQKVTAVNVVLGANGVFNVNWVKMGATTPTGMPDLVASMIGNILYTVKDGVIYVALDKSALSLLELLGGVLPEGINIEEILGLMTDMGGYYGLPIPYVQADGVTTFVMDKTQLIPILNVLSPILIPMLPEEMQSFAELLPLLANAQELELGLPFIQQ